MKNLARRDEIDLAGGQAGAARALHQVLDFGDVVGRKKIGQAHGALDLIVAGTIRAARDSPLDAAIGRQRNHAGRNAFENRFGEAAAAFELAAVGFKLVHHFIETAHQRRQLIHRFHVHAIGEIALAHLARRAEQRGDRHADLPGQNQRDPGGDKKNEERDQQDE